MFVNVDVPTTRTTSPRSSWSCELRPLWLCSIRELPHPDPPWILPFLGPLRPLVGSRSPVLTVFATQDTAELAAQATPIAKAQAQCAHTDQCAADKSTLLILLNTPADVYLMRASVHGGRAMHAILQLQDIVRLALPRASLRWLPRLPSHPFMAPLGEYAPLCALCTRISFSPR